MKKHLLISLIGLCLAATSVYADGGKVLTPKQCTIGDRPVYNPISEIDFTFAESIGVAADAKAIITCGGETVATGAITERNYHGQYSTEGIATITFDKLILPKGKTYSLEIPAGAIYEKETPTVKTENLKVDFEVPANIINIDCTVRNESVVESAHNICFYYNTETEPIGKPTMTLYREGVPVRTFEAHIAWDWDLGQASADFGTKMNFEKGVRYSLVLPAGSLSPRFRTDITNEETRVDFVGGYTEPAASIDYVWCSLYDEHITDVLGKVRFFYKQAIMLSPNPKILLLDGNDELLKEVTPTLGEEKGQWVVSCDFEGAKVPENGCNIVIPEGTIISAEGNVAVNARSSFSVNGSTGLGKASAGSIKVKVADRQIIIDNAPVGKTLSVYSAEGKKVAARLIASPYFTMELEANGIYIVSINGKSYKVVL